MPPFRIALLRRFVGHAGILAVTGLVAVVLVGALLVSCGGDRSASPEPLVSQPTALTGQPAVVTPVHTATLTFPPTHSPARTTRPSRTPASPATTTPTPLPTGTATPAEGIPVEIGDSAGGRALEVVRFGHGPLRQMIVAGIHGGYEENTVALADQLIDYLRQHPAAVPEEKTLYILRVLNPDGLARGAIPEGRLNANGVDLNRNWDAFWKATWQSAGCWSKIPLSPGSAAGSEPETQALAAFLLEHQVRALISYHSAGLGIFAGGQPPDSASKRLASRLAQVAPYQYPPLLSTCEYTGQLIDWASAHGIAAVDVELNNHVETDWTINLRVLKVFLSLTGAP